MEEDNYIDNPSAFPRDTRDHYTGNINGQETGMTLRDYFEAKALQGLWASAAHPDSPDLTEADENYNIMAESCYQMADAMLRKREID